MKKIITWPCLSGLWDLIWNTTEHGNQSTSNNLLERLVSISTNQQIIERVGHCHFVVMLCFFVLVPLDSSLLVLGQHCGQNQHWVLLPRCDVTSLNIPLLTHLPNCGHFLQNIRILNTQQKLDRIITENSDIPEFGPKAFQSCTIINQLYPELWQLISILTYNFSLSRKGTFCLSASKSGL